MLSTSLMSLAITYLGCGCGFEKKFKIQLLKHYFLEGWGKFRRESSSSPEVVLSGR